MRTCTQQRNSRQSCVPVELCSENMDKNMDMNQPKPRINASMLASCDGKVVTLLGKVKSIDNDGVNMVVEASDNVEVHVTMQEPVQELVQGLIEIHGVVQQNRVQGLNYVLFAPENEQTFDLAKYNQAVQYMSQLPDHYLQGASVQQAA